MYNALLKHKWPLLAFLAITLAGVQLFVGEDRGLTPRDPEQLAAANPDTPPAAAEPEPEPEGLVEDSPDLEGFYSGSAEEQEYVEDEELIDSTQGDDPSPEADDEDQADEVEYSDDSDEDDPSGEPVP
jgi:hypothetical protein